MNKHNFQVGDFIVAAQAGFHVITAIKRRFKNLSYENDYYKISKPLYDENDPNAGDEINTLIEYKQLYTENGKPRVGKTTFKCDILFCQKATDRIDLMIEEMQETIKRLTEIKNKFNETKK